jgi:hypothetical protein
MNPAECPAIALGQHRHQQFERNVFILSGQLARCIAPHLPKMSDGKTKLEIAFGEIAVGDEIEVDTWHLGTTYFLVHRLLLASSAPV